MLFAAAARQGRPEFRAHTVGVMAAVFVAAAAPLAHGQLNVTVPTAPAASIPRDPDTILPALPFAAGERLNYRVRVGVAGDVGKGSMWIEGPVDMRGTATLLLRSSFQARVGFISSFGRSDSWLDFTRMAALRYERHEKKVFSSSKEQVEMFPFERRWSSSGGQTGTTPCDHPLDELSFIYYIRTLPLGADTTYSLNRHYDPARNPVAIRVLRRETIKTPAGAFATVVVEMRVKDARRFDKEGVITLYLTDDARHIPVRIESAAPVFGTAVLTLESIAN